EEGVAVGLVIGQKRHPPPPRRSGLVHNHNGIFENFLHGCRDGSGRQVCHAAGRKRSYNRDRTAGIFLLTKRSRRESKEKNNQHEQSHDEIDLSMYAQRFRSVNLAHVSPPADTYMPSFSSPLASPNLCRQSRLLVSHGATPNKRRASPTSSITKAMGRLMKML